MPTKLKKTKSAGRFGARYGKKIRAKLVKVEEKQRQKQKCPFCNKILAEKVNLIISPNHNCPHCGERALLPINKLVEFEKEENR